MVDLGDAAELDLEVLVELQPDLSVGGGYNEDRGHAQLAAIAPTYFGGQVNAIWRDRLATISAVLDRTDEWRVIDGQYAENVTSVAVSLPPAVAGGDVSSARILPDEIRYQTSTHFIGGVLTDLGFEMAHGADEDDRIRSLSLEEVNLIDADHIFLVVDGDPAENDAYQEMIASDIQISLHAVQGGHVHEVGSLNWIELRG